MSKKTALVILFVGSLPTADIFFSRMYDYGNLFLTLLILPIGLFFSLLTYFLPGIISSGWLKFARWWIPLQILLVALIPEATSGNFLINLNLKAIVVALLSGAFVIVSVVLIVWKYSGTRRTK